MSDRTTRQAWPGASVTTEREAVEADGPDPWKGTSEAKWEPRPQGELASHWLELENDGPLVEVFVRTPYGASAPVVVVETMGDDSVNDKDVTVGVPLTPDQADRMADVLRNAAALARAALARAKQEVGT